MIENEKYIFLIRLFHYISNMEIIWCEPIRIEYMHVFFFFFFSIYSYANIYLNFVKVTLGNKFLFNFSRGNFVNSSFYRSFINGKNEEIWVKMLSYIAEPNARTFTQCYIEHLEILLSLLFCVNLIWLYSYEWVNIPLKATPLHRGVNLVHFKAGLLEPNETYNEIDMLNGLEPRTAYWNSTFKWYELCYILKAITKI